MKEKVTYQEAPKINPQETYWMCISDKNDNTVYIH